jgi:aromatic ring-cleaving dioxygenase
VGSVVNPDIIQHYHAHVYYDPASSRDRAARLRERVAATFPGATLGRWHDTPVGPHTQSMYQIAFPPPLLASFLPWLMLNRDGLSICSILALATPTPITSTTPSGWAVCCRCE